MKRVFVFLLVFSVLAASCASAAANPAPGPAIPAPAAAPGATAIIPALEVSAQPQAAVNAPVLSQIAQPQTGIAEATASTDSVPGILTAEAPRLTLEIVSVTSPVKRGESATLKAQTKAGARCSISVYYKSVRSGLESLNEKTAEASGNVSWTWKTGSDLAPGSYRIEVVSRIGDKSESKTVYFSVI